ncbi:MAG: hypothetical protein AB6733_23800 [Clostridiaceae bacterium]
MNIYQSIWDADMKGSGVKPILPNENKDISEGYAVVESGILKEVVIPEKKRPSYKLVEKLFDNYSLNQKNGEKNTSNEAKEIEEFLLMAISSYPMKLAKDYIEKKSNEKFNELEWYTYLHDLWFRQFDWDRGKDLSGFEHTFIGEQRRKKLIGHHFWYKYWLEDNPSLNNHNIDQVELLPGKLIEENSTAPFVVTAGYMLNAYDYEKRRFIKISKNKCAFFVGISAEGLLALGTVRALEHQDVPEDFIINNTNYKLELFKSPDGKSIRTFYPLYEPI